MVAVVYDLAVSCGVWSRNGLGFCKQESLNVQHEVSYHDHSWFWPNDGRFNHVVDDETLAPDSDTVYVLM